MTGAKRSLLAVLLATLLAGAVVHAAAGEQRLIERDHFAVAVPASWQELPELAKTIAEAMIGSSGEVTGGAIAHGDAKAGVFGAVMWLSSTGKVDKVRPELQAFVESMRTSLEGGGFTLDRFEVGESATRITVDMAGSLNGLKLVGVAVGVVDKQGILHGFAAQCMSAGGKQAAGDPCPAFVQSFKVTFADAELRKLEKKGKAKAK